MNEIYTMMKERSDGGHLLPLSPASLNPSAFSLTVTPSSLSLSAPVGTENDCDRWTGNRCLRLKRGKCIMNECQSDCMWCVCISCIMNECQSVCVWCVCILEWLYVVCVYLFYYEWVLERLYVVYVYFFSCGACMSRSMQGCVCVWGSVRYTARVNESGGVGTDIIWPTNSHMFPISRRRAIEGRSTWFGAWQSDVYGSLIVMAGAGRDDVSAEATWGRLEPQVV